MFTITPNSALDLQHAMFILSHYHVAVHSFSDGDNVDSVYLVVDTINVHNTCGPTIPEFDPEDEVYLAELAFQMNFRQSGIVCPHCKAKNPKEDCCGHLNFTSFIDR